MKKTKFDQRTRNRAVKLCHKAIEVLPESCAHSVGTVWLGQYTIRDLNISVVVGQKTPDGTPAFACVKIKTGNAIVLDAELGEPGLLIAFSKGTWQHRLRNLAPGEVAHV